MNADLGSCRLGQFVTNEWLGRLKNPCQRYLQEMILTRIYKMCFNKVHWQGSLYYFFN